MNLPCRQFAVLTLCLAGLFPLAGTTQDSTKSSAIRQLQYLLRPEPPAEEPETPAPVPSPVPPYLQIIPGADGRATLVYRCRYVKANVLTDALESVISSSGMVEQAESQNLIVINDLASKMDELRQVVLAMDVSAPQIMVEAKVVEVSVDDGMERELEVDYNKYDPAENLTYTFGAVNLEDPSPNPLPGQGGSFDFFPYSAGREGTEWKRLHIFLRWLEHARDVRILSSPNLIVDRSYLP